MSDLLSASSLLLAIAAILFSLWYPDIIKALDEKDTGFAENNVGPRSRVTSVILSKALPVAIVSLSVALIFLPDAIKITLESVAAYQKNGYLTIDNYDAVRTAYCFVTVLAVVLTIYMWVLVGELIKLRHKLGKGEKS